jgi:translation elongation factor EF-4
MDGYRDLPLVKLVIVINDKPIDEFSTMVHESTAQRKAKVLVDKLKTVSFFLFFLLNHYLGNPTPAIRSED